MIPDNATNKSRLHGALQVGQFPQRVALHSTVDDKETAESQQSSCWVMAFTFTCDFPWSECEVE
jgi:hypothetical protein